MKLAPSIRFPVDPGDIPAEKAARRLHLTLAEFQRKLPALLDRGFPPADPTTGMFDLDAIDAWRRSRHPHLFPQMKNEAARARAQTEVQERALERIRNL